MMNVSSNDFILQEDQKDIEESNDDVIVSVSSNDLSVSGGDTSNETSTSTSVVMYDYSGSFENLSCIGIFIIAVLIAQTLCISFILGFKK